MRRFSYQLVDRARGFHMHDTYGYAYEWHDIILTLLRLL